MKFWRDFMWEQCTTSYWLARLDWHFVERSWCGYRAGLRWWMYAGSDQCFDQNFLVNEIHHFPRLSYQTGCLFIWQIHSIIPTRYPATIACFIILFCIKRKSYGFVILSLFFSECNFHSMQHFSSSFCYLFEMIFVS